MTNPHQEDGSCRREILITPDDLAGLLRAQISTVPGARKFAAELNRAAELIENLEGEGLVFKLGETLAEYLPEPQP